MAYKVDLDSVNRFCGINRLTTELTLDVRRCAERALISAPSQPRAGCMFCYSTP